MNNKVSKYDLKKAIENYDLLSKKIAKLTAANLISETAEEQDKRIKHLLKPENYVEYFDYYFGINSGQDFADAPSSWFHQESYESDTDLVV